MQKTSVGLHSRGVIPAISVGNTSALPAGSPSGGVRVGAAANTRRQMLSWGRAGGGGGCFSPSDQALSAEESRAKNPVNDHRGKREDTTQ